MSSYQYPTDLIIDYSNSREYRECLRRIFEMDASQYPAIARDPEIDEESRDENEYDDEASAKALQYIYENTHESSVFQEFYSLAAARMFSEDHEIGLAVLFSYDFLFYFHPLLVEYFQNDKTISSENIETFKKCLG